MNIKSYTVTKLLSLTVLVFLMASCMSIQMIKESSTHTDESNTDTIRSNPVITNNLKGKQQKVVEAALESINFNYNDTLLFHDKKFSNDCSGLIYGIFWSAGIDLLAEISTESGNGVRRLYTVMSKKNLLHTRKVPNPGDLIFWNNTYGSWGNNPLSHIGIVVSADKDGNIEYVHNNTYLGSIRKEKMNLYRPHEKRPINNYMRYDNKYKKTAAELFDSFGMAWKL
ncbi:MAG: C40 family peptidase [Spirochaetaceae bacterium]